MIAFTSVIKRFGELGEKTGWTYIEIPEEIASTLVPGNKKSFRVKGSLDNYIFKNLALLPMGGGNFILPLNASIRRNIGKNKGATVHVKMEVDTKPVPLSAQLMECLSDEPTALQFFNKLPPSHQRYFSQWVESAKTIETKAKRIANTVTACAKSLNYGEMIRSLKAAKKDFDIN